jgi:hypothetical protein
MVTKRTPLFRSPTFWVPSSKAVEFFRDALVQRELADEADAVADKANPHRGVSGRAITTSKKCSIANSTSNSGGFRRSMFVAVGRSRRRTRTRRTGTRHSGCVRRCSLLLVLTRTELWR